MNAVEHKDVNEVITELENSIDNLKVYSVDLGAVQVVVERAFKSVNVDIQRTTKEMLQEIQ